MEQSEQQQVGNAGPRAFSVSYFSVDIGNSERLYFSEISGLKVETEIFSIEEGGENGFVHRIPGRSKFGNIILKRGVAMTQEFLLWHQKIINGQLDMRNISIIMKDLGGTQVARWNFKKAYPVAWTGSNFVAGDGGLAIETLEIAHQGFSLAES
jgi:phage tail-like protein